MSNESSVAPVLFLDHLAVVARSVEEGCAYVKEALGVDMPKGGQHPDMGTHNHLMALGPDSYMEVITIDPHAEPPQRLRWFGLDGFDGEPKLATWLVNTSDIEAAQARAKQAIPALETNSVVQLRRGEHSWKFLLTESGRLPLDGAFPTPIQWLNRETHVASGMADLGCRLTKLEIASPQADEIKAYLDSALEPSEKRYDSVNC